MLPAWPTTQFALRVAAHLHVAGRPGSWQSGRLGGRRRRRRRWAQRRAPLQSQPRAGSAQTEVAMQLTGGGVNVAQFKLISAGLMSSSGGGCCV